MTFPITKEELSMKTYKLAIVGATGLVGQTALRVLEEFMLPISEYKLFASSRSAGKTTTFMGKEYQIHELTESSFDEGFDFAIFSAGGDTSTHFSPIAASKGCIVVDNSSAFRMDPNVPLVVPEVNIQDAFSNNGIIANPNCSTIQAVVALKPLDIRYKIRRIVYSTYQAVSGAGQRGIVDLENRSNGLAPVKFPYPIYNNCLPHIDVFTPSGYTKEELKMINETRKILHRPNLRITATTVRVPVLNSHSESINVEFEKPFQLTTVRRVLEHSPGIIVLDKPKNNVYPFATIVSGHNEVFVGRIRRDDSVPNGLNLWVVADNIRKGAATNAVQIVSELIKHDA
jgi:aspartate-semialdehyde dehydrogenase